MTRDESIALFEKCEAARKERLDAGSSSDEAHEAAKAVWNGWAKSVSSKRYKRNSSQQDNHYLDVDFHGLNFSVFSRKEELNNNKRYVFSQDPIFIRMDGYIFPGKARFNDVLFNDDICFDSSRFRGRVRFGRVQFKGDAWFDDARFRRNLRFVRAKFEGDVGFARVWFMGVTKFGGAKFSGTNWFGEAHFYSDVSFFRATFSDYTVFDDTKFDHSANFGGLTSEKAVSFKKASFRKVPEFNQAHFREAPRLDHFFVDLPRFRLIFESNRIDEQHSPPATDLDGEPDEIDDSDSRIVSKDEANRESIDDEARFRALKRLALQGNDVEREHRYHKGERRSAWRDSIDPHSSRWWPQQIYDLISDYGWSIWRPFAAWLLLWFVSAIAYRAEATNLGASEFSLWIASLRLAGRNAFPAVGAHLRFETAEVYQYLYCYTGIDGSLPGLVHFIGPVQSLLSIVLLFFLFLALRNHFRIK